MGNPFVHVELVTQDVNKAKKFYSELFDWKLKDMPEMDYTIINVGEGTGGGMMKCPEKGVPSHWLAYILVDDVATSTKKAKSLGAKVIKDATEIPGYGCLSIIADPTGAAFGLWQPKTQK